MRSHSVASTLGVQQGRQIRSETHAHTADAPTGAAASILSVFDRSADRFRRRLRPGAPTSAAPQWRSSSRRTSGRTASSRGRAGRCLSKGRVWDVCGIDEGGGLHSHCVWVIFGRLAHVGGGTGGTLERAKPPQPSLEPPLGPQAREGKRTSHHGASTFVHPHPLPAAPGEHSCLSTWPQ